jgi:hypothetical protein
MDSRWMRCGRCTVFYTVQLLLLTCDDCSQICSLELKTIKVCINLVRQQPPLEYNCQGAWSLRIAVFKQFYTFMEAVFFFPGLVHNNPKEKTTWRAFRPTLSWTRETRPPFMKVSGESVPHASKQGKQSVECLQKHELNSKQSLNAARIVLNRSGRDHSVCALPLLNNCQLHGDCKPEDYRSAPL